MKSIAIFLLLIIWIIVTLILGLSVIGWGVFIFIEDDYNQIPRKLIEKL